MHSLREQMVVSPAWLYERVMESDSTVTIIDCRFRLDDRDAGLLAYEQGHIAGAQYASLDRDLSGPIGNKQGGRHPLPTADQFAQYLTSVGVNVHTHVVAYDEGGEMAARLWWLLRYFGHAQVSVLQGGIGAWQSAGFPLSADISSRITHSNTQWLSPQQDFLVSQEEVRKIVAQEGAEAALIDSRALPRYRGDVEPLDPRAGHIPGAKCYFWGAALAAPATYKSAAELHQHYASLVGQSSPIVYCGSGVTACVNVLAMRSIGILARMYAGSWSDWCENAANPAATGEE